MHVTKFNKNNQKLKLNFKKLDSKTTNAFYSESHNKLSSWEQA